MKSYFLENISSPAKLEEVLSRVLTGQKDQWLLLHSQGDAIAYFSVLMDASKNTVSLQADVSGRHYNSDEEVTSILKTIQSEVGGKIERYD